MKHSLIKVLGLVLLVGSMAGCRTYGGYGSEEALYRQMQRASAEFSQELEQMRLERPALEQQLGARPDGPRLTDHLNATMSLHEELIERHSNMIEELGEGSSHRTLRRAYGAMITDHELVRGSYRRARQTATRGDSADTTDVMRMPYQVVPTFYHRASAVTEAGADAPYSAMEPAMPVAPEEAEDGPPEDEAVQADTLVNG